MDRHVQKMLTRRGISMAGKVPKTIKCEDEAYGSYETFKKSDLSDMGHYAVENGEWDSLSLIHHVEREETPEEHGRRLCKEFDARKAKRDEIFAAEKNERTTYEKLKKKFEE